MIIIMRVFVDYEHDEINGKTIITAHKTVCFMEGSINGLEETDKPL